MKIRPRIQCCLVSVAILTCVLSAGTASGQQELDEAKALNQQAMKLYQAGKYAEAIPLAQRALAIREKALGPEHPDVAQTLNTLALIYFAIGENTKTEPLLNRALVVEERTLGSDHPSVALSLSTLALVYLSTRQEAKAEPLLKRALAIQQKYGGGEVQKEVVAQFRALVEQYTKAELILAQSLATKENALGPDHPDVARTLNTLALMYIAIGKPEKGEPLLRRALAIQEKAMGPNHPDVARTLNTLTLAHCGTYAMNENIVEVEPLYQRAEKILGSDDLEVAHVLLACAVGIGPMGDDARPLFQRALAIQERILGSEHLDVAQTLNDLASFYIVKGNVPKAVPLLQRALAIREKMLGPDHADVAQTLTILALADVDIGEDTEAESLCRRVLAIREKSLGLDHVDLIGPLLDLVTLYQLTGEEAKGESMLRRILFIREKTLGQDHPEVVRALIDLAMLYVRTEQYVEAEPLLQRAVQIQAEDADSLDLAIRLTRLGTLYIEAGQDIKAEPLFLRALTIYSQKNGGSDQRQPQESLRNLALVFHAVGQYAKAEPLLQQALTLSEEKFGPVSGLLTSFLSRLAILAAAQRDYRSAIGFYKRLFSIQESYLKKRFMYGNPEESNLQLVQSSSEDYRSFLSMIHQYLPADREAIRFGLELVLRRKGIVLDAESQRHESLQRQLSESAYKDWQQLLVLVKELGHLLLNKPQEMSADAYMERVDSLHSQIGSMEGQLAKGNALIAKIIQERSVTVEDVSTLLPAHAALVEFVKILDYDFAKGRWKLSWRYLAFVLPKAGEVSLVDLGEASTLEKQAHQVLKGIISWMPSDSLEKVQLMNQLLAELYAHIWAPLEPSLGSSSKIFVSPDDVLNLIPFSTLIDGKGVSLVENYELAYITSGRALVGGERTSIQAGSDLLLVANPAFDKLPASGTSEASISDVNRGTRDEDIKRQPARSRDFHGRFGPLPNTVVEALDIPRLIRGREEQKIVLIGVEATADAVKATRSPRVLHLATHGFFLPNSVFSGNQVKRAPMLLPSDCLSLHCSYVDKNAPSGQYENALVRSGLAFAGANFASQIAEGDDGLLTALEVSGMDLYGTDLVVLSACQTGVGEVQNGEGVFGLRRAFALAGAKNLLMSLWSVDDEITANQMKAFYQNWQEEKLPPAEALRQAQLKTIQELKAKYNGLAPPNLWAPFILQGAHALGP